MSFKLLTRQPHCLGERELRASFWKGDTMEPDRMSCIPEDPQPTPTGCPPSCAVHVLVHMVTEGKNRLSQHDFPPLQIQPSRPYYTHHGNPDAPSWGPLRSLPVATLAQNIIQTMGVDRGLLCQTRLVPGGHNPPSHGPRSPGQNWSWSSQQSGRQIPA